jgi:predicted metalloprotease with PDZ domain
MKNFLLNSFFLGLLLYTSLFGSSSHLNKGNSKREKHYTLSIPQNSIITYSIEPFYDVNIFRLIVVLEFQGDKSGETKIRLPNNYGSSEDYKGIKFLKALSSNSSIENSDQLEIKIVKHPPGSMIRIYYQIEQVRRNDIELGNHYMATINKQFFHFLGETFFIIPEWETSSEFLFHIYWNKMPSNWNLANSFGVNEKVQEVKLSISHFLHTVFVGGDFRILKRSVYENPIYIAIKGKWKFTDDQLCEMIQPIIREERDFWNDNNFPYYLITVLPIEGDNDQGGTGRINSYALFLSEDRVIDYRMKRLLAHETFHTWLGEQIRLSEPESLLYWFQEGFCDYYARLLLLRVHLISFDEYVAEYNKVLEEYFTSSARFEKNETLQNFSNESDFNKLTYQRGDIIANNLNAAIIRNSNGRKNLDDLLRELLLRTRSELLITSTGSLGTLIRYYGGEQILADIMKVHNSGAPLKVYPDALGPCMILEIETSRKFWFFGEKYEVPVYRTKNEDPIPGNDCFEWFGIK